MVGPAQEEATTKREQEQEEALGAGTVQIIVPGVQRDLQQEVVTGFAANLALYVLLLGYFGYSFYYICHKVVPYEFIDEIFHGPQTLRYISGRWTEWDSKITTPPGLYILGWLNYKLNRIWLNWSPLTIFRFTNWLGGIVVLPLMVLRPLFLFNAIGFWPVSLMCFPLLTTYYYLYYTDVWSTILILQSLSVALTKPFANDCTDMWVSSLLALASCWFRQTNIVWTGFIMVVAVERSAIIQKEYNNHKLNNYLKLFIHAIDEFKTLVLPYATNFILFFVYLLWNRSITLGDKFNHSFSIHLMQIFYCFAFLMVFTIPLWVSRNFINNYTARWKWRLFRSLFEVILLMLAIRFFTKVHPFLLSDNRHYTFYLYRKLIGNKHKLIKYGLMSLVYHFSTFVYIELMKPNEMVFHPILPLPIKDPVDLPMQLTHVTWTALIVCSIVTLVPSPLFEPRYYILPFYFWRLFITCSAEPIIGKLEPNPNNPITVSSTRRLFAEFLWYFLIDLAVLAVFIKKTIIWDTETFVQRIIW